MDATLSIDTNDWIGKTSREIKTIGERNGSIVLIPFGSLEQHGHHLPTGTDTLLATAMTRRAAARVENDLPVVVTPPIWAGLSPHHLSFGGTITAQFHNLTSYLEDVVDSAVTNGFDAVLFVNGHGGNSAVLSALTNVLGVRHDDVDVLGVTYFRLAAPYIEEIRDSDLGGMAHGGEFETSLMLSLYPETVDRERMSVTYRDSEYDHSGQEMFDSGPLSKYRPFEAYTDSGILGDPTLASEEKGEALLACLDDEMEGLLRQIHEVNAGEP